MNLHEYQAKQLFADYGLPVSKGVVVDDADKVAAAVKKIGGKKWMVKAQVHAGGRGKAGGVKLADSVEDVRGFAEQWLGKNLITYQTDATGEARFAKGILDAADAAFALEAWAPSDRCITFDCKKMRNGPMKTFSSKIDWKCLKIGPDDVVTPTWENLGMKK